MNVKMRNRVVALLAGATALCLGGAILGIHATDYTLTASAATEYEAFVNVGGTTQAGLTDAVLGLTQKNAAATTPGEVHEGDTLFGSYATDATYTMTVGAAGEYQVAVALKAETGKTLTIGGESVSLDGKSGYTVISHDATLESTTVTVAYTGEMCGVLVSAKDSKTLMTAYYNPAQVLQYGAAVAPQLENATGYYSDGTTEELEIHYGDINAATGVNVNFTSITVTGTIADTGVTATRYLITMPDDLIYFINCGSYETPDAKYPEGSVDETYFLNQVIFDYYGKENLINYGTPDKTTTKGGEWGIYTASGHSAPGDATFPYNTYMWTGKDNYGVEDMGYMLSGLTDGETYRVWIGSLSHWHPRTANITFNGKALAGQETLRINSSKSFTIFENVQSEGGKVDIHMTQTGDKNEPTLCFIAVQKSSTPITAAPSNPTGPTIVGMEDTSMTLTGVTAGAALRLYNEAKPQQLLYEEIVDGAKIGAEGEYVVDWGEPFTVSQFRVVQVTAGGASAAHLVSITDIENFKATIVTEGYTTGNVVVKVEAEADSGIAGWSYRFGEYGVNQERTLDRPHQMAETFEAAENGDYYIVVTSGLGVTYSEMITVSTIDRLAPTIEFVPTKEGWTKGAYVTALNVGSVAPVTEYRLLKDGKQIDSGATAPETIKFTETGEYTVSVKTAAGQTTTSSLRVSSDPVTTVVRKSYDRRQLRYAFGDSADYVVYSVTVYQVLERGVSRMTITDDNMMDVFDPGTYVVRVLTADGSTEMFSLTVNESDFSASNLGVVAGGGAGGNDAVALGVGLGVGLGGLAIAAAAVIVTAVVTKKKRS